MGRRHGAPALVEFFPLILTGVQGWPTPAPSSRSFRSRPRTSVRSSSACRRTAPAMEEARVSGGGGNSSPAQRGRGTAQAVEGATPPLRSGGGKPRKRWRGQQQTGISNQLSKNHLTSPNAGRSSTVARRAQVDGWGAKSNAKSATAREDRRRLGVGRGCPLRSCSRNTISDIYQK